MKYQYPFYILLLSLLSSRLPASPGTLHSPAQSPAARTQELVLPKSGIYTGAYMDFGESEDDVTLEKILRFEEAVGKRQAIIASSSYWGQQSFPVKNLGIIHRHGAMPLIFWSPWDKPYDQNRGPDRFGLDNILAGKCDSYIDSWADSAREFNAPFFVCWGLEMNGAWFPWSGYFYRDKKISDPSKSYAAGVEKFIRTYRYVVDRVRARGARNILWVYHVNNYSYPTDSWNALEKYYPGDDYVDWLGMSAYGQQFQDDPWVFFHDTVDYPYSLLAAMHPTKPIMMAEWGIGEFPPSSRKSDWIREALHSFARDYPRLKIAIFWHERWPNADGSYSNLRADSSLDSLRQFRTGISDPLWIERPVFQDKSSLSDKAP